MGQRRGVGVWQKEQWGRRVRAFRLFLNAENLGNFRQTQRHPLIRPTRAIDGRWTVDAWAPLDGRVVNGGARVQF